MTENSHKFITGIIAFVIYFTLISLVILYFNTKDEVIAKKYVKKNDNRIQVTISAPKQEHMRKPSKVNVKDKPTVEKKQKSISHKKIKPKTKPKKVIKKDTKKKIIKEKIIKKSIKKSIKKKEVNNKRKIIKKPIKEKVKKTSDLFSTIKTKSKPIKKNKSISKQNVKKSKLIKNRVSSANERINNSMKIQKRREKGIENAYFSKVQSLLETWPAQSEFAGEKAVVRISVKPTGMFDFEVKTQSNNIKFNKELIAFLKQLQRIGLGKHNAGRSYEFNVEFIAKE